MVSANIDANRFDVFLCLHNEASNAAIALHWNVENCSSRPNGPYQVLEKLQHLVISYTSCSRKSPQLRIVNYILFINSSQTQITYSHKEISTYQSARKVVRDWVFRSNCSKRCCARMSSQENNGQSENRHVIEGPFTQQPRRDDASVIAVPASFFHGHAWMRTASTRKEKRFLTTRTKAGKFSEARFGV